MSVWATQCWGFARKSKRPETQVGEVAAKLQRPNHLRALEVADAPQLPK